jgi:hypothetical protein
MKNLLSIVTMRQTEAQLALGAVQCLVCRYSYFLVWIVNMILKFYT